MINDRKVDFFSASLLFCFSLMFNNLSVGPVFLSDIFTLIAVVLLTAGDNLKYNVSSNEKILYLLFIIFICHSIFIITYHGGDYLNEVLRSFRVPLYYYVISQLFVRFREILYTVFVVFVVVHSILVVAGALNQQVFEFLGAFIRYEKLWWYGRGNGLTTSFDAAGFLILTAIILLSINVTKTKTFLAFFLLAAGFFTGRTFMVLGPIAFFIYHFVFQKRFAVTLIFILVLFLFSLIVNQIFPFLILFIEGLSSIGQGDGYYDTTGRLIIWAAQVADYISFLGTGKDLVGVDLGYLKTLHYGGLIYFLFQLSIVILIPLTLIRRVADFFPVLVFLTFFLIYNVKIYAFFSSIFMPVFFLLVFALANCNRTSRERSN
ncbi:hypothetical protein [Shewanella marisflavi]|uniref:Uncharacterized protein n=1 Tax=Shewanella marisflavi TaxID=260364 RepID=A0AAC9U172_9GAMM|nr:hypothetical protein [Shewanella marisflavi]ASJ97322.1 hypothetical protein CFF01_12450 [Shewanella marisflavi]